MKKMLFVLSLCLLVFLASCTQNSCPSDEIVCETVHRYGVPLDPQDWSERGKSGQVVSMRSDGVTVTRSYDEGTLHGECSYTFPNRDVIQKKEMYDRGALCQEIEHYPSGLPERQVTHESPQKKSTIAWYESGSPKANEEYANGKLAQGKYYNSNHQIESQVDESNGFRTNRDGVGRLVAIDTVENGETVASTNYHPDGTPSAVTPYVKGSIEGERRTYLPGGEPSTIEQWKANQQQGITTVFEQGEKRADVPYVNGVKQGVEKRYRGNVVSQEVTWEQGQQHGPTSTYVGNTKQTEWYFQGKKVANKASFDMLSNQ